MIFFLSFLLVWRCHLTTCLSICWFLFFPSVLIFSGFGRSISSVKCRFPLFIISMAHFSLLNSIPILLLYILTVCIWVSNSLSFLANSSISSLYIKTLINHLYLLRGIRLCISWECDWVPSSLLQIIKVTVHLPGICLFGYLPQLSFFIMSWILLSRFSRSSRQSLWLRQVCYTFWDSVISSSEGPFVRPFGLNLGHSQIFPSRFTPVQDVLIYYYYYCYYYYYSLEFFTSP